MPKFRSCHKAIMVITGRAHCIHIYININIFEIYFFIYFFILFIYLFFFLSLFSGTQLRICVQVATPLVSEILPDRCFSPFYLNFYEACLFSLLFWITVNSLLRISVISFSQHKNLCYRQICDGMHSA